jgi:site-specific recombinase XerD
LHWIKEYITFHKKRHTAEMGNPEVSQFLTYLAVNRKVAASTQNQSFSALLFLYSQVLQQPFDGLVDVQRAKKPSKLPVVFTKEEARAVPTRWTSPPPGFSKTNR